MRYAVALFVFILALGLSYQSVASETTATHDTATTCSNESPTACAESENHSKMTSHAGSAQHSPQAAARDWSHKRQQQVSAIFPEKQPNKALAQRPEKVKLVAPEFGASVAGTTAKLEWATSGGAENYHIQVSKDAGFNNRSMYVAEDKFVKGTSFEVSNLEPGVKYFWRVAAVNSGQESMYIKSLFTASSFQTK